MARVHGRPVTNAHDNTPLKRLRGTWARLAARLEALPPFWMAFAFTLTETVGASVLALPIALAGVGPLVGVVLILVLGLVKIVTIAALSEAMTRSGSVRRGNAYFGRVVADYLGNVGALVLVPTLLFFTLLVLLSYYIGLATTLASATGIHAACWAALLFLVNLAFLRRDSLNATLASALLIGAVNIGALFILTLLTLPRVRLEHLTLQALPLGGERTGEPHFLALVFGVILVSYFGHTSTGNCARTVLHRDPSGRALLTGNVAAMVVAMVLYSLWTIAVNGALPQAALLGQAGTAIPPLAAASGPVAYGFGLIYVILGMGMASIHFSLALANQVREWLPTDAQVAPPRLRIVALARRIAAYRGGRFCLGSAPLALLFVASEWLLLTERASFAAPLGFLGAITVPLLAGIFPLLMLVASRHKGEFVPRPVVRLLRHPALIGGVYLLFLSGILLHGLVIWTDPAQRIAALLSGAVTIAMTIALVRQGQLAPLAVGVLPVNRPAANNSVAAASGE